MCAFYCIWGVSLIVATLSMSIIFRVIHPLGPVVIVSESETATDLKMVNIPAGFTKVRKLP